MIKKETTNKENYIVITTIHPPTKAILKFAELNNYNLIIVGDAKTPSGWSTHNSLYISLEDQLNTKFGKMIPKNHYSRKMIGYIHAIDNKAAIIIDTDDDNIPYLDWSFPKFEDKFPVLKSKHGFVNIYSHYTHEKIWPRGLPLNLINSKKTFLTKIRSI